MSEMHEPARPGSVPATRVVLAIQLLATLGWIGICLPIGLVAFLPTMTAASHSQPEPIARLASLVGIGPAFVPFAWVLLLLLAAVWLHRGWPHGRIVGIAAAWVPFAFIVLDPLAVDLADGVEIAAAIAAATITVALATAPRSDRPPATAGGDPAGPAPSFIAAAPPRRISALVVASWAIAALGLGPLLGWLLETVGPASTGQRTWADGMLLLFATIVIPGGAVAAARGLTGLSRAAFHFAPAALAGAAPWAAFWLAVLASSLASAETQSTVTLVATVGLLGVGVLVLAVYPYAIAATLSSRAAFAARPGDGSGGLPRRVVVAAASVASGIVVLSIVASLTRTEPLGYQSVRLDGRVYELANPVDVSPGRLVPVGAIVDWSPGLNITDPTAYALPDVGPESAIAVAGSTAGRLPELAMDLYLRRGATLPAAWCGYVPIDDPYQPPGPCGPPELLMLEGRRYWATPDIVLPAADLGAVVPGASTDAFLVVDFELDARAIRDVEPSTAVGVAIGARTLAYLSDDAYLGYGHPLCGYPTLLSDPLLSCLGFDERLLFIEVAGREYAVELDLFEIPRDALAPYGAYTGGGMVDESGEPLLEPADPTAYRVEDVDPARAVAIIHGGRVRIARVNDGADSVPAALCRFLRDDGRDYLDGQDKEGGLARFGC